MERILKFRGKNIHTGEWLYGDYHRLGRDHIIELLKEGKTLSEINKTKL